MLAAIKDWQSRLSSAPNYQDASLWLGRSALGYRLGDRDAAADALLEAVRRMTPPPPSRRNLRLDGLPSGPNVLPQTKADLDEWLRSGPDSSWDFLSIWSVVFGVLPSKEIPAYCRWLESVSECTDAPEKAMAASIWLHAIASRQVPDFPEGLPPAAVRLATRFGVQPFGAEDSLEFRRHSFEEACRTAMEGGDPAAASLSKWQEEARRIGRTYRQAEVLWSLEQEVIVRFSLVDSEIARSLRALTRHLMDWAPPTEPTPTASPR